MKKNIRLKITEAAMLVLLWLVLLASPILFRKEAGLNYEDLAAPMQTFIPLFLLFLLNRFVLVPKLLFRKRQIAYFISIGTCIALLTLALHFYTRKPYIPQMPPRMQREMNAPPPPAGMLNEHHPPMHESKPVRNAPIPPFANFLIFAVLLAGFDTGLRISFKLAETEQARAKLEKEHVGTQLAFLRNQVSPHFFMNTLNNIHSLIDMDTEEAKESIIRLSKLMRHLLYDSEIEQIPIHKEIDFIRNYIDLMKLRYSDKVDISLQLPDAFPDKSIPPLLFTSFVENAFKHGISYRNASFINIAFAYTDTDLSFEVRNSNPLQELEESKSGIGLENARKRLDLIYGDQYALEITSNDDEHYVRLSIPI